ncbi:hypothetical protein XELAEV_18003979mg [Xenopus laevis]|uniref:Uncharacterized protein n=1 Tax=Xenopus laevis TaxID=8355 RepID=A0A974BS24_XENLA|nr:hypothetical protein XELAEV_18003979mg [Xenopus laevis]
MTLDVTMLSVKHQTNQCHHHSKMRDTGAGCTCPHYWEETRWESINKLNNKLLAGEKILRSESRERHGKCYHYVCDSTCKKTRIEESCTTIPPTTTPPTTTTCACHHEGREYLPGKSVRMRHKIGGSHSRERDGKCYRYVCDSTCKRPTRTEVECTPPTTTPPTTTTCACHHEGRMYQPGEKLQGSESRERNGKCYDYVCDSTCRRPTRREVTCTPTTPTTTTPTTITTCACHHEGREYLAGHKIGGSHSRERDGRCYRYVCDSTCKRPTRTEVKCTPPREKLQGSESRERNGKCYDYVCDSTCRRPTRREVTCTSTTPTTTTLTTTTSTTTLTTKCSCYHNGKLYIPGEEVARSTIHGKCYKVVCDGSCKEMPATEIPCTTTSTTTPTTTPTTTKTTTKSTTITTISTTTPCVVSSAK